MNRYSAGYSNDKYYEPDDDEDEYEDEELTEDDEENLDIDLDGGLSNINE